MKATTRAGLTGAILGSLLAGSVVIHIIHESALIVGTNSYLAGRASVVIDCVADGKAVIDTDFGVDEIVDVETAKNGLYFSCSNSKVTGEFKNEDVKVGTDINSVPKKTKKEIRI